MSHLLLSAAHKSSGKTTLGVGICAALSRRGLTVQPFKKGPDYIDPMWLSMASNRACINLDFFTTPAAELSEQFWSRLSGADIGIIEGNKGLYDGLALDGSNSNAALAIKLGAPVILVLDARGMTRGVAPLILGYQAFEKDINIVGVILNNLGGSRHEAKLRNVIEHYTDVRVMGAVAHDERLQITERHLGLIPSNEASEAVDKVKVIADLIEKQVDLDGLLEIAAQAQAAPAGKFESAASSAAEKVRIGIPRDAAFGFYYVDDLEAMEQAGAELVFFDCLNDSAVPDIDGLFIGGGFPETHMEALSDNSAMRGSIAAKIADGLPVYAECGGLMYLSRSLSWHGKTCDMVGAIPGDVVQESRPQGRGYVVLKETGISPWPGSPQGPIYAHEFHYSKLANLDDGVEYAYTVERGRGVDGHHDGIVIGNLVANYCHLRGVGESPWPRRFIEFVRSKR